MRVIDYTETIPPQKGISVQYRNPTFYNGPERANFVLSNDPKIIADYAEMGVPVWTGSIEKKIEKTIKPEVVIPTIPEDWRNLAWPKKRALAMSFTSEKNFNKTTAEAVLEEAYLNQGE